MEDNKNLKVLSIEKQEEIGQAVKKMIKEAPFYHGEKIQLYDLENGGLGIFPTAGSTYVKRYVSGSFLGRYAFYLRSRILPGADLDKVHAQAYLGALASWLEGKPIEHKGQTYRLQMPELTGGRKIQTVERTSAVNVSAVFQDGSMDFQVLINLDYFKK